MAEQRKEAPPFFRPQCSETNNCDLNIAKQMMKLARIPSFSPYCFFCAIMCGAAFMVYLNFCFYSSVRSFRPASLDFALVMLLAYLFFWYRAANAFPFLLPAFVVRIVHISHAVPWRFTTSPAPSMVSMKSVGSWLFINISRACVTFRHAGPAFFNRFIPHPRQRYQMP